MFDADVGQHFYFFMTLKKVHLAELGACMRHFLKKSGRRAAELKNRKRQLQLKIYRGGIAQLVNGLRSTYYNQDRSTARAKNFGEKR